MGLQPVESFVAKCIQLYETTLVRHGLMLVGPTMGGKTACYRVLQKVCPAPSIPASSTVMQSCLCFNACMLTVQLAIDSKLDGQLQLLSWFMLHSQQLLLQQSCHVEAYHKLLPCTLSLLDPAFTCDPDELTTT